MKIAVFGAGYVGLVTGACLAELGNTVTCCDISSEKIEQLKKGTVPFFEPGLSEVVERNLKAGRIIFTTNPVEALNEVSLVFIAVGTPSLNGGAADTSAVTSVASVIGRELKSNKAVVVIKSTVPLGTGGKISAIIKEELEKRKANIEFALVSNPEFLRQGRAVEDFMVPDRIVVGYKEAWAKTIMEELYSPLIKNGHPIFFMDMASSEMSKYAANTFIAARISLMNELAQVCEAVGADVELIRQVLGSDHRIGNKYIYPGLGYGGSCFPKDVQALANMCKELGLDASIVNAIETVNQGQKSRFAENIIKTLGPIKNKAVAVWGLSFKPNTDDMRSAPSLEVIGRLLDEGCKIQAFDPVANTAAAKILGNKITFTDDMYQALNGADALAVFTEWPQFKEPDFAKIKSSLSRAIIFDGRNIYSPERLKTLGFTYISVGRPQVG